VRLAVMYGCCILCCVRLAVMYGCCILCCVRLAVMYGCCIRVQLHCGQQFSLSADSELNFHLTIHNNGGGSGQNVHSEMEHTATAVTADFTYRYTAVTPVRIFALHLLAF
jgi:hypothetical protein